MIGIVAKTLGAASVGFVYACVATAIAETIVVASLWRAGALEPAKLQKYAAVVYGYELTDLRFSDRKPTAAETSTTMTRDELLDSRVKSNPTLATRQEAIRKGADDIRALVQTLSTKRERYEIVKRGFDDLLLQLEEDVDNKRADRGPKDT